MRRMRMAGEAELPRAMRSDLPGWRRLARTATGLMLIVLTVPLAGALSAVGFLGAASLTSSMPLLCAAGLVLGFGASNLLGNVGGRLLPGSRHRAIGLAVASAATAVVALVSAGTIARPLVTPTEVRAVETPSDTRFWELPTGSRIAYRELPARPGPREAPVVFLHGGPGAGVVSTPAVAEALAFLTELGHAVYLYDQIGGDAPVDCPTPGSTGSNATCVI